MSAPPVTRTVSFLDEIAETVRNPHEVYKPGGRVSVLVNHTTGLALTVIEPSSPSGKLTVVQAQTIVGWIEHGSDEL